MEPYTVLFRGFASLQGSTPAHCTHGGNKGEVFTTCKTLRATASVAGFRAKVLYRGSLRFEGIGSTRKAYIGF